jgi:hypothetical protein
MAMIAQNVVPTNARKSVLKCAKRTNAPIRIAAKIAQLKDAKVKHVQVLLKTLHVVQLPMSAKRNALKVNVPTNAKLLMQKQKALVATKSINNGSENHLLIEKGPLKGPFLLYL